MLPRGYYHPTFIDFIQFIEVTDLTKSFNIHVGIIIKRNDYLIMCGYVNQFSLNDKLHF